MFRSTRMPRRTAAALVAAVVTAVLALGAASASADSFTSSATGAHSVDGAILNHYRAHGGPAGRLGYPVTNELGTPRVFGRFNAFQGGAIYWSPSTGAHAVWGAILQRWGSHGWEGGQLGFPVTDELPTPDGRGRFNAFQGGSIYWTPNTGSHAVWGAILGRYAAAGWEAGPLGYPTTDELATPNRFGRFNHFERGSIYWSPATGAQPIGGAIRDRWGSLGWENSALGFPTSGEYDIPGGRAQNFQSGSVQWSPNSGTHVVGSPSLGFAPPGTQVVTVAAPSPGSTTAQLTAWERAGSGWRIALGPVPARIGSAGVGAASESSTRTPAGTFGLTEAFGRAGNPGTALPYRFVDGDDWWVSDVNSPRYNQYAQCAPSRCDFDERAGENLYAQGPVYDQAVVIDYNRAGVRGAGSAFFLHVTNGAATAGCVAIDRGALEQLMRWLNPGAAPVIAIGVG